MKNFIKSIGYLLFYILFQMITISVIVSCSAASGITNAAEINNFVNYHTLVFTIISNLLSLFVLFFFFHLRKKNFTEEINFKYVNVQKCIFPCITAFFYSMAFALVTYHMDFTNAGQITDSKAFYSSLFPGLGTIVQILTLLIISPLAEEIIFRGLILTRLQRSFRNITAIIVSGLLFGIIHAAAGGIVLVVGAGIIGIILGVICVKTKSLFPAILAHSAANMADFVIALLPELSKSVQYVLIAVFVLMFAVTMDRFMKQSDVY